MAITNSKQKWELGSVVNVGFVRGLTVLWIKSEYDYLPDIYLLKSGAGKLAKYYEFTPHNGLARITAEEAVKWVR